MLRVQTHPPVTFTAQGCHDGAQPSAQVASLPKRP
jgi:hypothetical protein